jgi:hypothetical protein
MISELLHSIDRLEGYLRSIPGPVVDEALSVTSFGEIDAENGRFANDAQKFRFAVYGLEPFSDDYLAARFHDCYGVFPLDVTRTSLFERDTDIITVKVNHGFWEHLAALFGTRGMVARYREMDLPTRRKHYFQANFLPAFEHAWSRLTSARNEAVVPMISTTSGVSPIRTDPGDSMGPVRRAALTGMVAYELAAGGAAESADRHREPLAVHDSYAMSKGFEEGLVIDRVLRKSADGSALLVIGPRWTGACRVKDLAGSQYFLAVSETDVMPLWRQTTATILAVLRHLGDTHGRITVFLQSSAYSPIACAAIMEYAASADVAIEVWDLGRLLDVAVDKDLTRTGNPLPTGKAERVTRYFERCDDPTLIFQRIR